MKLNASFSRLVNFQRTTITFQEIYCSSCVSSVRTCLFFYCQTKGNLSMIFYLTKRSNLKEIKSEQPLQLDSVKFDELLLDPIEI